LRSTDFSSQAVFKLLFHNLQVRLLKLKAKNIIIHIYKAPAFLALNLLLSIKDINVYVNSV